MRIGAANQPIECIRIKKSIYIGVWDSNSQRRIIEDNVGNTGPSVLFDTCGQA